VVCKLVGMFQCSYGGGGGGENAVAQWLKCCSTNRKVAGYIPDGVIEIFH